MRALLLAAALVSLATPALAQTDEATPPLPHPGWSSDGIFGTYDRAALQRGLQIYEEVCSRCHSMNLVHYRDLAAFGYDADAIKAIACDPDPSTHQCQHQVADGVSDDGKTLKFRDATPQDAFVPPDRATVSALAAVPPDLSDIVEARDGGDDYVYGILTGFTDAPANFKLNPGSSYNLYFPSHQIAMPQPLQDNTVTYADGTPATLAQEAHDVVTFLAWASDPKMEERKETGAKVMLFLIVMAFVMYGAKRRIWSRLYERAEAGEGVPGRGPHQVKNL
jgi:ubiquinol-cytochrome c reductase cytochrome c1 subunit